ACDFCDFRGPDLRGWRSSGRVGTCGQNSNGVPTWRSARQSRQVHPIFLAVALMEHLMKWDATSLDRIRTELMDWGGQLNELVQGPAQMLTLDGPQVLADLVCRIAVIGQVKAGKSSFVNALVGRPGLLPADVNPWTTAVTKLHFNCSNAPEGVAAA